MIVRPAREGDLPAIADIYDREVRDGVATFDLEPRPATVWQERLADAAVGDHLIVAEEAPGQLLGYCSSGPYRPKGGYARTRETTVYVAPSAHGQGVGTALYTDLLERLLADGIHVALAAVALPNPASQALHRRLGFEPVGVMREVGRKLDRWVDVEWWQRAL